MSDFEQDIGNSTINLSHTWILCSRGNELRQSRCRYHIGSMVCRKFCEDWLLISNSRIITGVFESRFFLEVCISFQIKVRISKNCIVVVVAAAIQQCVTHYLVWPLYDLTLNFIIISGFMLGEFISVRVSKVATLVDSELLISRGTVSRSKIYIPILIVTLPLRDHPPFNWRFLFQVILSLSELGR